MEFILSRTCNDTLTICDCYLKRSQMQTLPCQHVLDHIERNIICTDYLSKRRIFKGNETCCFCFKQFTYSLGLLGHFKVCRKNPDSPYYDKTLHKDETSGFLEAQQNNNDFIPFIEEYADSYNDGVEKCEYNKQNDDLIRLINRLGKKKQEDYYQMLLEKHFKSGHLSLENGVTDISTDIMHAEIKNWDCDKKALGQLIYYNAVSPRKDLRAYFFGKCSNDKKKKTNEVFNKSNIRCFEFIETEECVQTVCLNTGYKETIFLF